MSSTLGTSGDPKKKKLASFNRLPRTCVSNERSDQAVYTINISGTEIKSEVLEKIHEKSAWNINIFGPTTIYISCKCEASKPSKDVIGKRCEQS